MYVAEKPSGDEELQPGQASSSEVVRGPDVAENTDDKEKEMSMDAEEEEPLLEQAPAQRRTRVYSRRSERKRSTPEPPTDDFLGQELEDMVAAEEELAEPESQRVRTVHGLPVSALLPPMAESWLVEAMVVEDCNEMASELNQLIISELSDRGIEVDSIDEILPETHKMYGELSGRLLPRELVVKGRETECKRMLEFRVYIEVPEEEAKGHKVIGCRWVQDMKAGDDGVEFVRARLVAQQVATGRLDEAFAPAPPLKVVRLIISLCASKEPKKARKLSRHDCSVAFFHADVAELLYVRPPLGLRRPGVVWRLLKALYGTRTASRLFQDKVALVMTTGGYLRVKVAPSVYHHPTWDVTTLVNGDDFWSEGEDPSLDLLDALLHGNFVIKTFPRIGVGGARSGNILGREVTVDDDFGFEYHADVKHLPKLLKILELDETTKSAITPASKSTGKNEPNALDKLQGYRITLFQRGAGLVLYVSLDRVELHYAVKLVMQDMSAPTELSWMRLKRVARFMIAYPNMTWKFKWQSLPNVVTGISDGDWAGCVETRRSTSSGLEEFGEHLIASGCSTQQVVSISSAESEFYAMAWILAHCIFTRNILIECGIMIAKIKLFCDSSAARSLAKRQGVGKIRHMDAKHMWVQDYIARREVEVFKIDGKLNPSDLGTKILEAAVIWFLIDRISYGLPRGDRWGPTRTSAARGLAALLICDAIQKAKGLPLLSDLRDITEMVYVMGELVEYELNTKNYMHLVLKLVVLILALVGLLQWKFYGLGPRHETTAATVPVMPTVHVNVVHGSAAEGRVNEGTTTTASGVVAPGSETPAVAPVAAPVHAPMPADDGLDSRSASAHLAGAVPVAEAVVSSRYDRMNIIELRRECVTRGIRVTGMRLKAEFLRALFQNDARPELNAPTEGQLEYLNDIAGQLRVEIPDWALHDRTSCPRHLRQLEAERRRRRSQR